MNNGDKMNDDLHHARMELDRRAADLDELTLARLRAARLRAVEKAQRPARAAWWLPMSAAMATVVAVTLALSWWHTPDPATLTVATDDAEWLLVKENPDLFNEQLEFYDWLSDEGDAG